MGRRKCAVLALVMLIGPLKLSATADEKISLPGAGELIVDSEETRKRLLATELAVLSEGIGILRSLLAQHMETEEAGLEAAANAAVQMVDRMRAGLAIQKRLDPSVTIEPWLQQEELILQVLLSARAVKKAETDRRETDDPAIRLQTGLQLLRATTSLLARQLELAKMCGDGAGELSRVSQQKLEIKRRVKSLNDEVYSAFESAQIEQVKQLSEEVNEHLEQTERLIQTARDLCDDQFPAEYDAAAVRSHVETVSSRSECRLASFGSTIAKTTPIESEEANLRSLQIEKLALLRRLLPDAGQPEARGGGPEFEGNYGEYLQTLDDMLQGELDLCRTTAERIARRRQQVSRLENAVDVAESEFGVGLRSRYELEQTKIHLLDARISLLREKSRDDSE